MQSDIDAQLTNSFEEAPPRDFVTAMRGYDRQQVDEHISQIEAEVRQHREQAQAMQRGLSEAHRQLHEQQRPTYSGLGTRIEQLLRRDTGAPGGQDRFLDALAGGEAALDDDVGHKADAPAPVS